MNILDEIIAYKKIEVKKAKKERPLTSFIDGLEKSQRDFQSAITCRDRSRPVPAIIAEIKKASPSEGIIRENFDHIAIAKIYNKYAQAISVLTDEKFFQGSLGFLKDISQFSKIPLLRKDFIIDEYQIYEARYFGADAILLIASVLDSKQIEEFINIAKSLNMDCLVEIHNEQELERILKIKNVEIIGINNRDLSTFKIDLNTTIELRAQCSELSKKDFIFVSESGINSWEDIHELSPYVDSFLIGTVFMKSEDIEDKMQRFIIKFE